MQKKLQPILAIAVIIVLGIQYEAALGRLWVWYKDNREAVVSIATGIGGIVALWVAFGQFQTARLRHEEQTRADLQRRITESFSKATEQLGSDKIEVRLGGIYTLERISKESDAEYWTIMDTLTAFVRERARWKAPETEVQSTLNLEQGSTSKRETIRCAADIQAVLTVIGRRDTKKPDRESTILRRISLAGADLRDANFAHMNFAGVDFGLAHLEWSNMFKAHLEGANLSGAYLYRAFLCGVKLMDADINNAHLELTNLTGAVLKKASLYNTDLSQACLGGAHLEEANLQDARLAGAIIRHGNFSRATGLTVAQIDSAIGNARTILPDNIQRPAHWSQVLKKDGGPDFEQRLE